MMHFEQSGAGERVFVAFHGWGGNHLTYAPLAPYLPAGTSMFAADLPGYGRSPRSAAQTAEALAADIVTAVERLGVPRLTLVGNCSGAILACLAATALGARIERVALVDPFAFVPWYFKVFIHPAIGRYAYYSTFANPMGRWLTNASLKNKRAGSTHLTDSFREVDHEVSLAYLSMLDALGSIDRFASISAPVDILYGERTFGAVKTSLADWRRVLPQARTWEIGGAGHLPIDDAPADVASIVFEGRRRSGAAA
jgi:pimeloyl-ACP methyl ester carboxylesterase